MFCSSVYAGLGREQNLSGDLGASHERGSPAHPSQGDVSISFHDWIGLFSELYINSKELQFSLLSSQDIVKLAEFEVTHRDLYTYPERLPSQNGVLDRRLVSIRVTLRLPPVLSKTRSKGYHRQRSILRDLRTERG